MDQLAQLEPSAPSKCRKWWHVSDEKIEELIHKKMDLGEGPQGKYCAPSALRSKGLTSKAGRSVQFREALKGDNATARNQFEDSLDQALREHVSPVKDKQKEHEQPSQEQRKQIPKAWRVPDERILDMVTAAANTLVRQGENVAPIGRVLALYGKNVIGSDGDYSQTSGTQSSSCLQDCMGKSCQSGPEEVGASNKLLRSSSRRALGVRKSDSCTRPAWDASLSNPRIFAGVGIGLDGKGNKTIKPLPSKFEANPIYLSDFRDSSLSRVREAVCGNAFYLKR
jgi:hypothetical protein